MNELEFNKLKEVAFLQLDLLKTLNIHLDFNCSNIFDVDNSSGSGNSTKLKSDLLEFKRISGYLQSLKQLDKIIKCKFFDMETLKARLIDEISSGTEGDGTQTTGGAPPTLLWRR